MGDVAMSVPVLRAFCKRYPEIKITVLTRGFFKTFFRDLSNITVYEADVKGNHKGVLGLYKLSKELRDLDIDAIADLHNVLRSKLLQSLLYPKPCVQIDKGRAAKKALVAGKRFEQLKTSFQRYADVFEKLGFPFHLGQPEFPPKVELSSTLLLRIGAAKQGYIGIAPFAAFPGKTYDLKQMQHVIAQLSKNYKVLLFGGGKREEELLEVVAGQYENTVNLAGQLTLDEELDVISNLNCMIAMDSGNAHIAAMLGVHVITLWGVTHPFAGFYPFYQKLSNALLADRNKFPRIPTSIYGNKHPETYEDAINTIRAEDVVKKVMTLAKKSLQ
ncbi:MAG: glycosyltransferase family 9 protein [Flavobacteriaceae bacterium]|nr:glycosyltransferase family 9 protein [Flavobacteriaceae bacterium]